MTQNTRTQPQKNIRKPHEVINFDNYYNNDYKRQPNTSRGLNYGMYTNNFNTEPNMNMYNNNNNNGFPMNNYYNNYNYNNNNMFPYSQRNGGMY